MLLSSQPARYICQQSVASTSASHSCLQERAADCGPADLAALGRQAVGLLRCVGECLQLVQAMHKCLEEVKEVRKGMSKV